ncbi:MAG TPA: esterase-like activity of phytase family protein [Ferruginibacter sp.]|nr:esterase-like activity of phytase family protein [Ferruginibacter sp.]
MCSSGFRSYLLFFSLLLAFATPTIAQQQSAPNLDSLKFLGVYIIPLNFVYNNTIVGGLSGIDYDTASKLYYIISDDRSDKNPARFYEARISFTEKGIDSFRFVGVKNMLQPNGAVYPNSKQDPYHTPDPEAMRYDPISKELVWSSEGERIVNADYTVLEDPTVIGISTSGKFIDSFLIPPNLVMQAVEKGPRQNAVFEGLSFADNYKTLFVSVEEPLYEDGPRADITDNNTYTRILKFNMDSKKTIAQYAYKISPIPFPANPPGAFKMNGIPDILTIGHNKLLLIERSYSTGRLGCSIRLFIVDLNKATDISDIPSLSKPDKSFIPASKKLLLDMKSLGIYIDNIEGVTFGPKLPNGHKTLLFIADNNFSIFQKTELLLFEVK